MKLVNRTVLLSALIASYSAQPKCVLAMDGFTETAAGDAVLAATHTSTHDESEAGAAAGAGDRVALAAAASPMSESEFMGMFDRLNIRDIDGLLAAFATPQTLPEGFNRKAIKPLSEAMKDFLEASPEATHKRLVAETIHSRNSFYEIKQGVRNPFFLKVPNLDKFEAELVRAESLGKLLERFNKRPELKQELAGVFNIARQIEETIYLMSSEGAIIAHALQIKDERPLAETLSYWAANVGHIKNTDAPIWRELLDYALTFRFKESWDSAEGRIYCSILDSLNTRSDDDITKIVESNSDISSNGAEYVAKYHSLFRKYNGLWVAKKLASTEEEKAGLQDELRAAQLALSSAERKQAELTEQLSSEAASQIAELTTEMDELRKEAEAKQAQAAIEAAELNAQLERLKSDLDSSKTSLVTATSARSAAVAELEKLKEEFASVQATLGDAQAENTRLSTEAGLLTQQIEANKASIKSMTTEKEALNQRVKAAMAALSNE